MSARPDEALRFRVLGPEDRAEAAAVAAEAFAGNGFYQDALGFDRRAFPAYWEAFIALALGDRCARVLGVELGGELEAVVVVAYDGFPGTGGAFRFVARLLARVGPRRTCAYLHFVASYDRAMRRPRAVRRDEARGLWLMARARGARPRTGASLARFAADRARAEGKRALTGLVDAGNGPLLAFYRRLGYRIGSRFRLAGHWAAVVELELGERPC
jgi:ribosomal protein S18 acetylase RimI-like enzyme